MTFLDWVYVGALCAVPVIIGTAAFILGRAFGRSR
jgi:hypothetical protein